MTFADLIDTQAAQILLLGAILVAVFLIHKIAWRFLGRWFDGRRGVFWRIAGQLRRPLRMALLVLALALSMPLLTLPLGWETVLERVARAALVVAGGWVALVTVSVLTERAISRVSLDEEDYGSRSHATQLRVLQKVAQILIVLLTAAVVLWSFESVRSVGVSLFASAGAAGLVLGFAARPVLANLIAGIQIALTQPIRLNDVVIVEGEWGWIEEIRATYVIVRIWDLRRLVVPLSYFIEKPFQNWTRDSSTIIGQVIWYLDWTAPVGAMRERLAEILAASDLWDGNTCVLQVVETTADAIQLRALMSARNAPRAWDLRCEVREKMIAWLQEHHPSALPRLRAEMAHGASDYPGAVTQPESATDTPGIADISDPSPRRHDED